MKAAIGSIALIATTAIATRPSAALDSCRAVINPNATFPDAVVRGGEYNDGPGAGVFAIGSADPTTSDASIGSRCAP